MSYDSITNRGDYLSPHYLAEVLPRDLKKQGSLRTRWADREKAAQPTPVRGLRGLRREYFDARLSLKEQGGADQLRNKEMTELNGALLRALGFPAEPRDLAVERAGEAFQVPVAYAGQNVLAIDCDWAADTDAAFDADDAGRLLAPVEVGNREEIETGAKLARWLFAADEPPRYVLLLHGGVIVLADRLTWGEGRYLAVSLDAALERADAAELELIAALFSADALQPPAEGGEEPLAAFVAGSASMPSASPPSCARACASPCRSSPMRSWTGCVSRASSPATSTTAPWPRIWAASRCASCTGSCSCCTPRPGRSSASCPSTTKTMSPGTPWPASATLSPAASAARRRARASTCTSRSRCCSAW